MTRLSARDREVILKLKKAQKCPFLYGLRVATISGLLKVCEWRKAKNKIRTRVMKNAHQKIYNPNQITLVEYPECLNCSFYKTLRKGYFPKELKHVEEPKNVIKS